MGNGESSFGGPCGSPRFHASETLVNDQTGGVNVRAPQSAAEVEAWCNDVKKTSSQNIESMEERFERYMSNLRLSEEQVCRATDAYIDELEIGLECNARHPYLFVASECSFKMLDSCVDAIPNGSEHGVYYALDFGGTNFRVVRLQLKDGEIKESQKKASLAEAECPFPKGLMDPKATASQMFGFFARIVKEFMISEGDFDRKDPVQCGFTFSFPITQRTIDTAVLITWTKGFETARQTNDKVENMDVGQLMNIALEREGVPMRINSVANDTVGTMLSCAYSLDHAQHPPCLVGLILGTGYNACYFDEKADQYHYRGKIINIESGNFNRELPRTNVDHSVDFSDVGGRGRQHLEKMVAGGYLGEVCRETFVKILQHRAPPKSWFANSFASEDAAVIISDKSANLIAAQRVVFEKWESEMGVIELQMLKDICTAVFERSAALAAVAIAGCAGKTGFLQEARGGLSVGIDGSLYKCNEFYRVNTRKYLDIILKEQSRLVHLLFAEDGSGRGAGILAAVVDSRNKGRL